MDGNAKLTFGTSVEFYYGCFKLADAGTRKFSSVDVTVIRLTQVARPGNTANQAISGHSSFCVQTTSFFIQKGKRQEAESLVTIIAGILTSSHSSPVMAHMLARQSLDQLPYSCPRLTEEILSAFSTDQLTN